jgi:hypothetical protein
MAGCQGSKTECICADPALRVHVPSARAAAVVDVVPSGPACDGARVECAAAGSAGGCTLFVLDASAAGTCHVDVDFSAGPPRFSADAQMVPGDECCGGFYASPLSAADIEIPALTGDAGGVP